jgi:hypothetical protein
MVFNATFNNISVSFFGGRKQSNPMKTTDLLQVTHALLIVVTNLSNENVAKQDTDGLSVKMFVVKYNLIKIRSLTCSNFLICRSVGDLQSNLLTLS